MPDDVFEQFATEYDRWFEEHNDEYHAELERVRRLFPGPDSGAVEIGAGSGRFAAPLGIRTGIEPSRALGLMAYRRGIGIIRGRAEAIPFRDESCTSVLMVTVICFLNDPVLAFREIHRILIPEGTLVLGFIERDGHIARKYKSEEGKRRFLSRARFYTPEEVGSLLEKNGFRVDCAESVAGFCVVVAHKV